MIAEILLALSDGMGAWRNWAIDERGQRRRRASAIGKVMEAAIATKAYLCDIRGGSAPDREKEHRLARLWQTAAVEITEYDHQLFVSAELKALGWADPAEWGRIEGREWVVEIDNIIAQCQWLRGNG